jgi:hypothetical protein
MMDATAGRDRHPIKDGAAGASSGAAASSGPPAASSAPVSPAARARTPDYRRRALFGLARAPRALAIQDLAHGVALAREAGASARAVRLALAAAGLGEHFIAAARRGRPLVCRWCGSARPHDRRGCCGREHMRRLNADPAFAAASAERSRETMRRLNADPAFAAANAERSRERMRRLHAEPAFAAANAERSRERMTRQNAEPEFRERSRAAARRRRTSDHDLILDLWAAGRTSVEIAPLVNAAFAPEYVSVVVARARRNGDPRAVAHRRRGRPIAGSE